MPRMDRGTEGRVERWDGQCLRHYSTTLANRTAEGIGEGNRDDLRNVITFAVTIPPFQSVSAHQPAGQGPSRPVVPLRARVARTIRYVGWGCRECVPGMGRCR